MIEFAYVDEELVSQSTKGNVRSIKRDRFRIEPFDAIDIGPEPEWLLQDIIPSRGLGLVIGETGSGKTFLGEDLSLHISMGSSWAGKKVRQGAVVYITGEGASGFRKRLAAFRLHHRPRAPVPFYLIADSPDLGRSDGDAQQLALRIEEQLQEPVRLIVIDTLARMMAGADESSSADMSAFVTNCGRLESIFKCAVLVVHHVGKDAARGARGSSVLKAAADVEIVVECAEGERTAKVTKSKDGESGLSLGFSLERVELEAHGRQMTSCVVSIDRPWSETTSARKGRSSVPRGNAGHLHKIIRNALSERGRRAEQHEDLPPGVLVVHRDKVREEARVSGFAGSESRDNSFRAQLSKALSKLVGDGVIGMRNDWIWVTE